MDIPRLSNTTDLSSWMLWQAHDANRHKQRRTASNTYLEQRTRNIEHSFFPDCIDQNITIL